MEKNDRDLARDLKEAAVNPDASLDELKKRGVKKVNVLTPEKINELINRRASELVAAQKAEILARAQAKIQPIIDREKELLAKLQAVTARLEATEKLLETERTKSFREGADSQKPAVERQRDENLALRTRVKELEEYNRALLRQQEEQLRQSLSQYREQIAQLAEEIRRVRTESPPVDAAKLNEEILKQYRDEISQLRRHIDTLAARDETARTKMHEMVSDMEKSITARISEKIDHLKEKERRVAPVLPKEVILDNLFKDMPETNAGAMKVRQSSGKAIDEHLERLKDFHDGRDRLELDGPEGG